jgi:hypothetical protein
MRIALAALAIAPLLLSSPAHAEANDPAAWLAALRERVDDDIAAGKPLVVQAHVALCSNEIIRCGGHGLGDGDDAKRNLYWGTSGGFLGWFGRKGSGWTQVYDGPAEGDVLDVRVWKRTVKKGSVVYVVAHAWRGSAIDDALSAYVTELYGEAPRSITLDDGTKIEAGGAAQIVSWVGHNRWMDLEPYDWKAAAERASKDRAAGSDAPIKGTIAVACKTKEYLAADVPAASRVPLLMTSDFLFAGAHSFEGAVWSFANGGSYAEIRDAAAAAYATGEKKEKKRVKYAFTNPGDPKW